MANHPNRGRRKPSDNPPPELIIAAREAVGHTQTEMAEDLAPTSLRTVQAWEGRSDNARPMHPQLFSRYLSKNGLIRPEQDWIDWAI